MRKKKKKSRVNGGTGSNGSKLPPLPLQSTFTLFSEEGRRRCDGCTEKVRKE